MTTIRRFAAAFALALFCLFVGASAQTPAVSAVNLTPDADKVRISAVGDVLDMRVVVSDEAGDVVFESGPITGDHLDVLGTLSKDAGAFKIDHPLDPANKYLYHSFVESPDMMNIYNGNVTLDTRGEATVTMPQWFNALNKEFRYQLTAVGAPGPNLHIAQEMKGNRFLIAGGKPGMKVSWQVTGIRKDAYAEAHRIPVEQDKPERERGSFLHPELHGQSKEKSFERARYPGKMRGVEESAPQ